MFYLFGHRFLNDLLLLIIIIQMLVFRVTAERVMELFPQYILSFFFHILNLTVERHDDLFHGSQKLSIRLDRAAKVGYEFVCNYLKWIINHLEEWASLTVLFLSL